MSAPAVFFGLVPVNVADAREWSPPLLPGGGIAEVASRPLTMVSLSCQGFSGAWMKPSPAFRPSVSGTVGSPSVQYVGDQPCGAKIVTSRVLGLAADCANAVTAGTIDSRNGSARATPVPRRNVRLGRCFFVRYMIRS